MLIIACFLTITLRAQDYFQQNMNFDISVELNDTLNTLSGFETIRYANRSNDTLYYIWFHIWQNAYKSDTAPFAKQLIQHGRTDLYFADKEQRGYIDRLNFTVDREPAAVEQHPQMTEAIKLLLPHPLNPGDAVTIETPFHVKLPFTFSRSGHRNQTFQITQWYPKPAVYDNKGWHIMPYLDQGEFYGEFADYQIKITIPEKYTLAAGGIRTNTSKNKKGTVTHFYSQQNVHDYAWFVNPDFLILQDTLALESGRIISVESYFTEDSKKTWHHSIDYMKSSVRFYSRLLGEYPYESVKAVEVKMGFEGGMEYPGITAISGAGNTKSLDLLLAHEIGHNWFYGIIASNERDYPWMDEGMNTYYEYRYEKERYPQKAEGKLPESFTDLGYRIAISNKTDQPIATAAHKFSMRNYGYIAYHKAALWMQKLENFVGTPVFDSIMKSYYDTWKFKHPYPVDFKTIAEGVSNRNLTDHFSLLDKKGPLEDSKKKTFKISGIFSLKETDKYKYLFVSPALGINYYDKVMAGILVHNYTLPVPHLHFFAAPMYGIKSKSIVGTASAGYDIHTYGHINKIGIGISGSHFNVDRFTDSAGSVTFMPFTKVVPFLKVVFRHQPLSEKESSIRWKTFLITETNISFRPDSSMQKDIITFPKSHEVLNQLTFSHANKRVLYPYSAVLNAEQGEGFLRLGFNGNYFFNYPTGDGLTLRFFAGKFIYLKTRTNEFKFKTNRYHLNMTGANGYEDYTYSNYFVGRNEYEGAASQQIMMRDGGFKIRTDLLNQKIGKSDDWLLAVNLNTPFPEKLNPLQVLPFQIPLKIYADAGTFAEAWQKNATAGKFLYDAGLQIALLDGIANIYLPLLYSEEYRNYYKTTIAPERRFWKRISFSIDLQKFDFSDFLKKAGI